MLKALVACICGVVSWLGSTLWDAPAAFVEPSRAPGSDLISEIKAVDSWSLINPIPYPMSPAAAALCRNLTKQETSAMFHSDGRTAGPHANYFVSVRVNEVGEKAMLSGSKFPFGTIIIKDKLSSGSRGKELSTVMIKREKGFNLKCGDWEFAILSGKGDKVESQGKLQSCMACHEKQAKLDYTYRTYLPTKASPAGS